MRKAAGGEEICVCIYIYIYLYKEGGGHREEGVGRGRSGSGGRGVGWVREGEKEVCEEGASAMACDCVGVCKQQVVVRSACRAMPCQMRMYVSSYVSKGIYM